MMLLLTAVTWILFFTHILLVPFILNWNTISLYGNLDHTMATAVLYVHIARIIVPAILTILWIYTRHAFLVFCPFAVVFFYFSLICSMVLQCMNGSAVSSIFLNIFIGAWVSCSVYGIKQFMDFTTRYRTTGGGERIKFRNIFNCFDFRSTTTLAPKSTVETSWEISQSLDAAIISDIKQEMGELDQCAICLDGLKQNLMSTTCGHVFHTGCLLKWTSKKNAVACPLCNGALKSGKYNEAKVEE
eukprot:NODE_184_length_15718_cov_0.161342.p7 type:complete len:244 gc:universal NODE_184_length_15718_cov_0.161342:3271-4002(+)